MLKGGKVLVVGGRHFREQELLNATLDTFAPSCVVHGAAIGADAMASEWARAHGVEERPYPANWRTFGRAAGPRRNAEMLRKESPDLVVAFPGGKGTADMIAKAKDAGIEVYRVFGCKEVEAG